MHFVRMNSKVSTRVCHFLDFQTYKCILTLHCRQCTEKRTLLRTLNTQVSLNVPYDRWYPQSRYPQTPIGKWLRCIRCLHVSKPKTAWDKDKPLEKQIVIRDELFTEAPTKDKNAFFLALETFMETNTMRRGHIEFIYTAMTQLENFGVHTDIEAYKKLMSVFPPGRFVPQNKYQVAFFHFPRHQVCAVDLLDKMENYGVCPDLEMRQIIVDRFGDIGDVFEKFGSMLYWFPKFKFMSPFPLPLKMPTDSLELAKLAIKRIMVDLQSVITIFNCDNLKDALDKTWIVSGQSPIQQQLISKQGDREPFFVEGPFVVWLKKFSITYYLLRAENKKLPLVDDRDPDDISNLDSPILNPTKVKALVDAGTIHEQEDGIVLGVCATGTSSRDSLLSWIRFLQETNPRLKSNPIVFTLKAPSKDLVTVNQSKEMTEV